MAKTSPVLDHHHVQHCSLPDKARMGPRMVRGEDAHMVYPPMAVASVVEKGTFMVMEDEASGQSMERNGRM